MTEYTNPSIEQDTFWTERTMQEDFARETAAALCIDTDLAGLARQILIKELIATRDIIVDTLHGTVYGPRGKPLELIRCRKNPYKAVPVRCNSRKNTIIRIPVHEIIYFASTGTLDVGSYHIHHINGDITDNRIENLQKATALQHSRLHYRERLHRLYRELSARTAGRYNKLPAPDKIVQEIRAVYDHAPSTESYFRCAMIQHFMHEYGLTRRQMRSITSREHYTLIPDMSRQETDLCIAAFQPLYERWEQSARDKHKNRNIRPRQEKKE